MRAETARIYSLASEEIVKRPWWIKPLTILLVILIFTVPSRVLAQPVELPGAQPLLEMPTRHLFLRTGDGELRGPDGKSYRIPAESRILQREAWSELDAEMMRLQEAETRLTAENKSLRESADSVPWLPIAIGVGLGVIAGFYGGYRLAQ